jgi:hypothetical protein
MATYRSEKKAEPLVQNFNHLIQDLQLHSQSDLTEHVHDNVVTPGDSLISEINVLHNQTCGPLGSPTMGQTAKLGRPVQLRNRAHSIWYTEPLGITLLFARSGTKVNPSRRCALERPRRRSYAEVVRGGNKRRPFKVTGQPHDGVGASQQTPRGRPAPHGVGQGYA